MSLTKNSSKFSARTAMKALKDDLFNWICEKHATNCPLDRRLLREKALELTQIRGLNGFKCSEGWLTNFLKEHRFAPDLTNHTGPIFDNYRDWIDLMRSTITRYRHDDLFHADELSMYSDVVPTRISSSEDDNVEESGATRNRITVLMCCNSSGTTKLPLLICGPYPSNLTKEDHIYRESENSRIGEELFRDWLSCLNDRMSRCNRKILLLLRRMRAHAVKDLALSNVKLVFFPEDFPPLLRPLRRDVFHYVKMIYRRRYAERLKQYPAEWSHRDVVETLIDSWEKVPREIIITSFQRTHFRTDDYFLQLDCPSWEKLRTGISFRRFVTFDDDLSDERSTDQTYSEKNRNHRYNLRNSRGVTIQIDENSVGSVTHEKEENFETRSQRSSEPTSQNDGPNEGYYLNTVLKDHIRPDVDQASDPTLITTRDKNHYKGPTRSEENRVERSADPRKSQKRPHSESHFSRKDQKSDQREGDTIMKNVFPFHDPRVGPFRSIDNEFREKGLQSEGTSTAPESVQAIIDKALSLTSTTKADYARRLIDSIYASNEEARRNTDNGMESDYTNDEETLPSKCANTDRIRNLKRADEDKVTEPATEEIKSTNAIPLNSCFGSRSSRDNYWRNDCSNQPSTSNQWYLEESTRTTFKNRSENQTIHETSPGKSSVSESGLKTIRKNRDANCLSSKEDSNQSSVHQEVSKRSKRRRWTSSNMDGSGDDSNNGEPAEKRSRTDCNWSKQYETTFVFGSPNISETSSCSSRVQHDGNIVDSCRSSNRSQERQSKSGEMEG